jgi:hypothetical protein
LVEQVEHYSFATFSAMSDDGRLAAALAAAGTAQEYPLATKHPMARKLVELDVDMDVEAERRRRQMQRIVMTEKQLVLARTAEETLCLQLDAVHGEDAEIQTRELTQKLEAVREQCEQFEVELEKGREELLAMQRPTKSALKT